MTDAEKYVAVFRAAARGVMKPYPSSQLTPGAGSGQQILRTYTIEAYNHALSIAEAFNAIADVFQTAMEKKDDLAPSDS